MNILYATMQFSRGYAQGTERYVAMLSEGMRQRGHRALVMAGDPERRGPRAGTGEPMPDDPSVLYYPTRGWMSVTGLSGNQLQRVLDRLEPDVVHVANPAHIGIGLLEAARSRGIPTVVTIMDFWWLCPKHTLFHAAGHTCDAEVTWQECLSCMGASDSRGWVRSLAGGGRAGRALVRQLYLAKSFCRGSSLAEIEQFKSRQTILLQALRDADAVIFPSRGTRRRLEPAIAGDGYHDVPYGLESRWFSSSRKSDIAQPSSPDRLMLGYAGALAPHKGPHLLLEALQQLGWSKTSVRIAGGASDGGYLQKLHRLSAGLNVEFVGSVSSADMPAFLGSLDLFVMTSIWPENLPIVVLETQAVGTPVMAARIDGVTETVPESMLFEAGSAADLARALENWTAHPINPAPHQPVSTADEMVERTMKIYEQLQ